MTEEEYTQCAVIDYFKHKPSIIKYLWHTPNGGYRNIREAAKLKRMGVKRGVSDLFLAIPNDGYHGMFIEMKSKKGKLTFEQREFIQYMEEMDYKCVVCKCVEEAIIEIKQYLVGYLTTSLL